VIKELNKRLDAFTSSKDQFDDVTMLIVKSEEEKLSLHYEKKDYSVIDEVVDKFNEKFFYIDSEVKAKVGIILDELINNFISYETREDLVMDFDFSIIKNVLTIQIKTNGNDYDPFKNHKDKYLTSKDKDATLGGFGIKIVKEFVDSHKYEYIDNHSIITLTKKLSQK
jgi:anti-sigma regulatory factor (Ser/Thr protein kinase)